jgi:PhoPQ-activated pathogenicity-related protein
MKTRYHFTIAIVFVLATAHLVFATPLDDYVAAPDANYRYSLSKTIEGKGYKAYVLDMTSQSWRTKEEVDNIFWKHWLTVIMPDKVQSDKALLWITGGSNDRPAPNEADSMLAGIAMKSNAIVAELRMVPNQPLVFPDGGRPRYEDGIIAYTFNKFIETGDETWPLLLPMVKSAVRAMDTIQSHVKDVTKGKLDVKEFVVSGASKRGWTTWLTAAVDKRVIAIVPVVIDVLNMSDQMRHHYSAYGFYSDAIKDYQEMDIFSRLDTEEGKKLRAFIDPYEYIARYTLPKFMINSPGDQFFLPDSARFYFHDLPGAKYLRYVPNTDHGLKDSDAPESLLVFYVSILKGLPLPKFGWRLGDNGLVVRNISGKLKRVNLWQVSNAEKRDFRLETIGPVWRSSLVTAERGSYVAQISQPDKGWTAFFAELIYDSGFDTPYKFTTQVYVVPDTLPFAEKTN